MMEETKWGYARNLELFIQTIFNATINFFVNTRMKVLHKPKKSKVYVRPSSGYFIYALGWNIMFILSFGYCI